MQPKTKWSIHSKVKNKNKNKEISVVILDHYQHLGQVPFEKMIKRNI